MVSPTKKNDVPLKHADDERENMLLDGNDEKGMDVRSSATPLVGLPPTMLGVGLHTNRNINRNSMGGMEEQDALLLCNDDFDLKEWGLDLEDFGTENGAADDMVPCSHFKHHTMGAEVPNVACLHRAHTVEQETALPNSNDGTPPASKPLLHTNGSVKRVRFREQLEDVFEERDDVGSNRSKRKTRTDMVSPKSVLKSPSQLQDVTPVGHANGDDTVKEHIDGRGGYPNSNNGEDGNQKNGGDDDEHDNGSDDAIQILMDDAMELLIKSSHVNAMFDIHMQALACLQQKIK